MWRHPKYYKELRKRNKPAGTGGALCVDPEAGSDQAISKPDTREVVDSVRPDPGHKQQATSSQASSGKRQAPSRKRQASSRKLQADES